MELLLLPGDHRSALVVLARRPREPVPAHAILGVVDLVGQTPSWEAFRRNRAFVEFFTRYMRGELPQQPAILAEARVQPREHVYLVDPRVPDPRGEVPFRDLVGWYESGDDGRPIRATFTYNEEHLLVDLEGRAGLAGDSALVEAALALSPADTSAHPRAGDTLPPTRETR